MQYEDGDKEEFVLSELRKKKTLQPESEEDRTDFEELDRLYGLAKTEWAAGQFPCLYHVTHVNCVQQCYALLCRQTLAAVLPALA